jgi:nicotinate phosphoribosyltransferase
MSIPSQSPFLPLPAGDTGLFTDLYELTMGQSYFSEGMGHEATFSLYMRDYPPDRGYMVAAGIDDTLDCLSALAFDPTNIDYLRTTGIFTGDFLEFLAATRFTGSVRAVPEGSVVFADEPIMEISAPIIEAQLVETIVINQIQYQTLLATKSARCVLAAQGRAIADFASRRTHGTEAALAMARASYMAGFAATSNVLAARRYEIPPAGTMAHSYITGFSSEIEAFRAYARMFPERSIFLLDTYDTISGARNAALVAGEMEDAGHRLTAVRLDSGDLDHLSRQVRSILDEANLGYVRILASGGLDEYEIERLVNNGARIDMFGVGTRVGVSGDAPWCDMVYKMVCYDDRPVMKLSGGKESMPGSKQIFRQFDSSGSMTGDVIALAHENIAPGRPLLAEVMTNGQRISPRENLAVVRQRVAEGAAGLSPPYQRLREPARYPVEFSSAIQELTQHTREQLGASINA